MNNLWSNSFLFLPQNRKTGSEKPVIYGITDMPSNLKYTKDYIERRKIYQLVLPLSLEGLIPDDDSVRQVNHELEELDYTLVYQAYSARSLYHGPFSLRVLGNRIY